MSIIAASKTNKLGTKRTCRSCSTRFYDFEKPEPACPKCKAIFDVHAEPVLPALAPISAEDLAADREIASERKAQQKRVDDNEEGEGEGDGERDEGEREESEDD